VIRRMLLTMESVFDREFESHKPLPPHAIARNREETKTIASCRHGLLFGTWDWGGTVIAGCFWKCESACRWNGNRREKTWAMRKRYANMRRSSTGDGRRLVGVAAHVFAAGQDVALHGALEIFFGGAGLEIHFGVEGIELEEVAMELAAGRARATITNLVEVVGALARAVGGLRGLGKILRQRTQCGRHVKHYPMNPGSDRGVGIVRNQRETLRGVRRGLPLKRGRKIAAIAGERFRYSCTRRETRAD
jgi:HAMP domain-containing protein